MSRGKYATRARTKRDADLRYAAAVSETNEVRQRVHALRHLRTENEQLRRRVDELSELVATGSSEKVAELEARVVFLETDRVALIAQYEGIKDRSFRALVGLADHVTSQRRDNEWWKLVAIVAEHTMRLPKNVAGNHDLIIARLKEEWGDRPKPNRSAREQRHDERQQIRSRRRRSTRRPKIDYSNPAQLRRLTEAEAARAEEAAASRPEAQSLT